MVSFHKWKAHYAKFVEGYGFALIVTICVGIITGSAVWTARQHEAPYVQPTPPASESGLSASLLMQQSLQNAATPTPLPTASAKPSVTWQSPLTEYTILREFDPDHMHQSAETGLWSIHSGIDLGSPAGTPVHSVSDGIVVDCGQDALRGCWLTALYDNTEVTYAGMAALGALQADDRLHAGQTIGFVGSNMLDEKSLGPHLHITVRQHGEFVDPSFLIH